MKGIWYVVGWPSRGLFVFLVIGLAWLDHPPQPGDRHKGMPYERRIETFGDHVGRFGISFYVYALPFVAFDVEVVFLSCGDRLPRSAYRGLVSMGTFVLVLILGLATPGERES